MTTSHDLILINAVVHGFDGMADAVAVSGGTIVAVGAGGEMVREAGRDTEIVDCRGHRLLPGIVDAHCHLFAMAARRNGVDCRPSATPTLAAMVAALRDARPVAGGWVLGYGYDDSPLGLGRHLERRDLDAVSDSAPVRVAHRSGHALALNGVGLDVVGISADTPDPPGGVIVRDANGSPTGLLLDMEGWLRERVGASVERQPGGLRAALAEVSRELLGYGITAVMDAGADNGLARWRAFEDVVVLGVLPQRVTMMVGVHRLEEMRAAGLQYGDAACGGMLKIGHAKIMLTASSGGLHPDPDELARLVVEAHRVGYPVAIHAVERDAVVAAALALSDNPATVGQDRIEHCGECPPDVAELVAKSGARVVTNPGFLHYDGRRYLATVEPDLVAHLYPTGALAALGIPVALASDAPVVEANPWAGMAAAVSRRTAEGNALGGVGLPSVADAVDRYSGGNRIEVGRPADLAVMDADPLAVALQDLPGVRAVLTVVDGGVAWRNRV